MKKHELMPKWLRGFFPKKFTAITISKNTAWYRDFKTLDDESVRRHEEVHMMQYERHGWFLFIIRYLWYTIKHGYWNNPLEIEAREKSK